MIVSIAATKFRSHLFLSLAWAGTALWQVMSRDELSRIGPLLTSMNLQYTGPGRGNAAAYWIDGKGMLTASNCNDMAIQSMPLCFAGIVGCWHVETGVKMTGMCLSG